MEALLAAGLGMVMAEATKQLTGKATTRIIDGVCDAFVNKFGRTPEAMDGTEESLGALLADSSYLPDILQEYIGESPVLRRLRRDLDLVDGASLLWVDDHPQWNSWEIACLEAVGMIVRTAETTQTALALAREGFDVVVSDIARGENPRAGLESLAAIRTAVGAPLIFYVGKVTGGVPVGAFGITAYPDELLHLVLDVAERARI